MIEKADMSSQGKILDISSIEPQKLLWHRPIRLPSFSKSKESLSMLSIRNQSEDGYQKYLKVGESDGNREYSMNSILRKEIRKTSVDKELNASLEKAENSTIYQPTRSELDTNLKTKIRKLDRDTRVNKIVPRSVISNFNSPNSPNENEPKSSLPPTRILDKFLRMNKGVIKEQTDEENDSTSRQVNIDPQEIKIRKSTKPATLTLPIVDSPVPSSKQPNFLIRRKDSKEDRSFDTAILNTMHGSSKYTIMNPKELLKKESERRKRHQNFEGPEFASLRHKKEEYIDEWLFGWQREKTKAMRMKRLAQSMDEELRTPAIDKYFLATK